jgi:peptidoglycan/xylan/chitin deacetylase (PgdA/CDA1 family)
MKKKQKHKKHKKKSSRPASPSSTPKASSQKTSSYRFKILGGIIIVCTVILLIKAYGGTHAHTHSSKPEKHFFPLASSTSPVATSTQEVYEHTLSPQKSVAYSQEISHGNIHKNQVTFTFDGGSIDVSGYKILEVLEKHKVRGTFFLTGKFVEANPALVQKMVAGGHEIFNHTYSHLDLTTVSATEIINQFEKMENVLLNTAHVSPKPYFRPPYGSRNPFVLNTAATAGYQSVYWTTDALDWKEGISPNEVKSRILSGLTPGAIYLMHIGDSITGDILDEMITTIEARGYKAVSLTEALQ